MAHKKHNRLFWSFIYTYICVLLVQFTATAFLGASFLRHARTTAYDATMQSLASVGESLQARFQEIKAVANQISVDSKYISFQFVKDPFGPKDIIHAYALKQHTRNHAAQNMLIKDYYVLYRENRVVAKHNEILRYEQFYPSQWYIDGYDATQWYALLFDDWYAGELAPLDNGAPSPYVVSMGSFGRAYAVFVAVVNQDLIAQMLAGVQVGDEGYCYILDENGRVFAHNARDGVAELVESWTADTVHLPNGMTGMRFILPETGWTFVAVQSNDVVMGRLSMTILMIVLPLITALVVGLLLAYLFAAASAKPLHGMLSLISNQDSHILDKKNARSILSAAEEAVKRIAADNETLRETVAAQLPMLQSGYLSRLLHGEYKDRQAAREAAQKVGIPTQDVTYAVAVIEDWAGERAPYQLIVAYENAMRDSPQDFTHFTVQMDISRIVTLLVFKHTDQEQVRRKVEWLGAALRSYHADAFISVGSVQHDVMSIHSAHRSALSTSDFARFSMMDKSILWYEDLPGKHEGYEYNINVESRLINVILMGDQNQLIDIMNQIYIANFEHLRITERMARLLQYEMWGTAAKLLQELQEKNHALFTELQPYLSFIDDAQAHSLRFSDFVTLFSRLCDAYKTHISGKSDTLHTQIITYLQANYDNTDMSLLMLSNHFTVSPSFISTFFREQIGDSFYSLLEKIRMEKAKELLALGTLSISEVAAQVGYGSMNSFGRAFKRANGISPRAFRETITNESGIVIDE